MIKIELDGAEAIEFAAANLKKLRVNVETWEVEYLDEKTGDKWLLDYPHGEHHGGGSPRLRRVE